MSSGEGADLLHDQIDDLAWMTNDSTLANYGHDFCVPGLGGLQRILDERLGGQTEAVGLDVAGGINGVALQDMMREGYISRGVVTNYADNRTEVLPEIHHVAGDLKNGETWLKLFQARHSYAPRGFDVILHRPDRTLQDWPPHFYAWAGSMLTGMLAAGGLFVSQIPTGFSRDSLERQALCNQLQRRSDLEIHLGTASAPQSGTIDVAVILKKPV